MNPPLRPPKVIEITMANMGALPDRIPPMDAVAGLTIEFATRIDRILLP